jgi:hypothetical protein
MGWAFIMFEKSFFKNEIFILLDLIRGIYYRFYVCCALEKYKLQTTLKRNFYASQSRSGSAPLKTTIKVTNDRPHNSHGSIPSQHTLRKNLLCYFYIGDSFVIVFFLYL